MEVLFATTNKGKFAEAETVLGKRGIVVKKLHFEYNEIRSDSLGEIALDAVLAAYAVCGRPVFVEDAGLFIKQLKGFPGTYSGWVYKKIGVDGILRLLNGIRGRDAEFRSVIAYHDGRTTRTFTGVCRGTISERAGGKGGFGYDSVFVPAGKTQTFAENIIFKNRLSHRYNSLIKFSEFLSEQVDY